LGVLNKEGNSISDFSLKPAQIAELVSKIETGELNGPMAKQVFEKMVKTGKSADEIIKKEGIKKVDSGNLEEIIIKVIKDNPKAVEDFAKGKQESIGFLTGQIMRETKGQADPKSVGEILRGRLNKLQEKRV